jgi:maleylpyruvate isomerase
VPALPAQLSGAEQFEAVRFATEGLAAVRRATSVLFQAVDGLDETTIREPSRLAGWTRGHVVTHLSRNADGCVNLLHWARTGIESPMYPSIADREADIQEGSHRLAQVQQEDLKAADERLFMATEIMSEADWEASITNAQGLPVGASIVPWMRLAEVLVHYVDLNVGAEFDDIVELAGEQLELLTDYVATRYDDRPGVPAIRLAVEMPSGTERVWLLGGEGSAADVRLTVSPALAWLTGRPCPVPGLPTLPGWL